MGSHDGTHEADVAAVAGRTRVLAPQRVRLAAAFQDLVHLAVRETPGVVSRSEGDGFLKRVRIERGSDA